MALLVLSVAPVVFAVSVGSGVTPSITTEEFAPRVWMCDNRIVSDDNNEPGRIFLGGQELVERINNYAFEGERISWNVLVMDKNKIDQNIDVYATIGDVQGEGNDIEVNCKRVSSGNISSCNARIGEEKITKLNSDTMSFFQCTLTVETPESMYGEYWMTIEAQDGEGNMGTMDENEYWFLNPTVALSIDGDLTFDDVRPGTAAYSDTLLIGNDADDSSGVMLDMFISGTDFYDSSSSGARCSDDTNKLSLSAFRYYVTNGAYNSKMDLGTGRGANTKDAEGYLGIGYSAGPGDMAHFDSTYYNSHEILQAQQVGGSYYTANVLAPGAEMALTFKLSLPEPCVGDFDTGQIYFWGEAI